MRTFLSWLIANICGIVDLVVIATYEILLFQGHIPLEEVDVTTAAIAGVILVPMLHGLFVGGMPFKNAIGDGFNICILALGYALTWWGWKNDPSTVFMSVYAWGLIPSLILAIIAAIFTASNMYEVVSRRMLFVNSNASIFEMKLLYTFNRFVATFSASSFLFLCISLLNKFYI